MIAQEDGGGIDETVALTQEERDWLAAHPEIRIAPDPEAPPFEFFDDSGTYRGIAADYLSLLEDRLGIRFQIVRLESWDEVLEKAKAREVDMLGAAMETSQRAEYLLFTSPHIQLPGVILATTESDAELSLDDLRGKRVTVVSGWVWHELLRENHPEIELLPAPNVATALQMTSFKIADAMVGDQASATYYIEKSGLTNLRVAGSSGYRYDLAIATRKDWPVLNSILQKALATVSDEEKAEIRRRWIGLKQQPILAKRELWVGALVVALGIILIVGAILAWSQALKRRVARRTEDLGPALQTNDLEPSPEPVLQEG